MAGYLTEAWKPSAVARTSSSRTERITAQNLAEQLASASPPLVLDVRAPSEVEDGHIEGSLNVPLNHLEERLDEIPRDRPLVVTCASGYRSSIAVSILERHGRSDVTDLVGGMGAWEASRLAITGAR